MSRGVTFWRPCAEGRALEFVGTSQGVLAPEPKRRWNRAIETPDALIVIEPEYAWGTRIKSGLRILPPAARAE